MLQKTHEIKQFILIQKLTVHSETVTFTKDSSLVFIFALFICMVLYIFIKVTALTLVHFKERQLFIFVLVLIVYRRGVCLCNLKYVFKNMKRLLNKLRCTKAACISLVYILVYTCRVQKWGGSFFRSPGFSSCFD